MGPLCWPECRSLGSHLSIASGCRLSTLYLTDFRIFFRGITGNADADPIAFPIADRYTYVRAMSARSGRAFPMSVGLIDVARKRADEGEGHGLRKSRDPEPRPIALTVRGRDAWKE